ncbi:HAD-IIB family hydrolase [Hoeflea sp.]|uniref:HAD-IIB family hydrolase n=1 Tax=Hoeflea sp. TaxID=1940281 RepID=UPI0025BD9B57|nr:HAD-IIB family hydrolase [Hoeflea sp.]
MTAPAKENLIIFTDLDGTILDHETYSYAEALPALSRLKQSKIPLILASSKTAAEIIPLRAELGFSHCEAIVENGSGILEAGSDDQGSGEGYQRIQQILDRLPPRLRRQYQGFSDWSAEEVSVRTGLSLAEASRAKQRRFSEPGLWLGNEASRGEFVTSIKAEGLTVLQGGRFMTLSFGGNKAERLVEIAKRYSTAGAEPFTVALGDAENDVAMIEAARLGIIIPNPAHGGIPRLDGEATGRVIRAPSSGPEGWNQVITSLLDQWQGIQEKEFG